MLPGTAGSCWDGAVGDRPLLGAGKWHSLTPPQPPRVGHGSREESWRYCASGQGQPGAVDTGGDAAGSRRRGQTHLPERLLRHPGHACRLNSEIPAQIRPPSAPAPLHGPASPCAGDGPCGPQNLPASCCPVQKARGRGCSVRGLGFAPRGAQHPSRSEAGCVVWVPGSPVPLGVLTRGKKLPPVSWRK